MLLALLGFIVFLLSAFIVKINVIISFILSIIAVSAFIYMKGKKEEMQIENTDNEHADVITALTREIRQDLKNVSVVLLQVINKKVHIRLEESTTRVRDVLNEIEQGKIDAKLSRRFIVVYIAGLERLIISYLETSSMQKLYSSLDILEERFDEELKNFKKDNILSA